MHNCRFGRFPVGLGGVHAAFLVLMVCFWSPKPQASAANVTTGAFSTGEYRNLFVEGGHSPQEITNRVWAAFRQLFHGDPQTEAVYFPSGTTANGPLAFIFAMSLYFAANRWGSGTGIYDYHAAADRLLTDLRHRQLISGQTVLGPMTAGAIFESNLKLVRFTPDVANWNHTDPSYQLPAFYSLWALWGPKGDRAFWAQVADASREFFRHAAHPRTGLAPDYANFDGTPWAARWNPHSADFQYDSWRTAMNWSVDWAWWAKDPRQRELSDRLQAFFESQGISTYGNRFTLEGKQFGSEHATGLVAMNAVASLAATQPRARRFVEEFWNIPVPTGQHRYYDGMLYLLAMLHCSGEFRIWLPH